MFQPHETFDHPAALGLGNAGTAIFYCKRDALPFGAGFDYDLGQRTVILLASGLAYLMALSIRLASA